MKKIVRYECWQMDCERNDFDGEHQHDTNKYYKYKEED